MSEAEKQIDAFFNQPIHKDHVGEERIIDDADIETHYLWAAQGRMAEGGGMARAEVRQQFTAARSITVLLP